MRTEEQIFTDLYLKFTQLYTRTQVEEEEELDVSQIETLIEQRKAAREAKDWAKADECRDALTAMGVVLEDTAEGTVWKAK